MTFIKYFLLPVLIWIGIMMSLALELAFHHYYIASFVVDGIELLGGFAIGIVGAHLSLDYRR